MGVWDNYSDRVSAHGDSIRDTELRKEKRFLDKNIPKSLSYTSAVIFEGDQCLNIPSLKHHNLPMTKVSIFNSYNLDEKTIVSMPGEVIHEGSLVWWMDNFWIVSETDANTTLYSKGKLLQCNYLLRWVSDDRKVYEQWCIIEDGTKYLTGELDERHYQYSRGDSRIAMTIGRNSKTVKLGRDNRFLIDDYESPLPIAYRLTKPLKLGKVHNGRGAFKFVLQEVPLDPDDNYELNIAEYYKYFEKDGTPKVISSEDRLKIEQQTLRRYCSIECDERAVYNGLDPTMFTAHFSDEEDEQILTPEWEIECDFLDKLTVEQDGNAIYISADNKALTNKSFVLSMYAGQYEKTSITVQIKALM